TDILELAKEANKPVIVHVVTKKGKGYSYAEKTPDVYHGVGPFDKEKGIVIDKNKESYSSVFGRKLTDLAEKNEKVVAITAAMPDGTGLNEFRKKYPDRFFDVGIAEEHAVTFAGGLAKAGYVPVFAVYSTFLQRTYDQIMHDVALQNAHVIFAIDRAGIVGQDGATHQGIYDLAFLSSIPNLKVLAPKDGRELERMLEFAVSYEGPIAIRYPRDSYVRELCETKVEDVCKAEILESGEDVTIIGFGKMVKRALDVKDLLEKQKISAEVINLRALKPLDKETILTSIRKTKKVITIEDGIASGGVASAIQGLIIHENDVDSMFFAYPDEFISHGKTEEIEKIYGMDAESIADKVYCNLGKIVVK
ncbi:MAG: 1-deoxy-D-xylulose-5-phosphate synthase, partial [Clostridia bacterium]|nr:1-deoxy-D-xylulose-5-phosphate synthase [Clostridia bacterium]